MYPLDSRLHAGSQIAWSVDTWLPISWQPGVTSSINQDKTTWTFSAPLQRRWITATAGEARRAGGWWASWKWTTYIRPITNKTSKDCYKYVARFLDCCHQFFDLGSGSEPLRVLPRKQKFGKIRQFRYSHLSIAIRMCTLLTAIDGEASSGGCGCCGCCGHCIEMNNLHPTHNKQDFLKDDRYKYVRNRSNLVLT